ncbi:hypothetical protein V6N13_145841 [Hibiscus sabdariffa]|uniref:Uncharacterized protein n=1 Tax=Hibiscus sabdariffa TaxID=183260 RepID=A0ABR2TQV8_9ROSI
MPKPPIPGCQNTAFGWPLGQNQDLIAACLHERAPLSLVLPLSPLSPGRWSINLVIFSKVLLCPEAMHQKFIFPNSISIMSPHLLQPS